MGEKELAIPTAEPIEVMGSDDLGSVMPRLHIYSGTSWDVDKYGTIARGSLVHTVTKQVLVPAAEPFQEYRTPDFILITGYLEWMKWGAVMGGPPEYKHRRKADVPKEDLAWRDEGGRRIPPAAQLYYRWVVMLAESHEAIAINFTKGREKKAKEMEEIQKRRAAAGMVEGAFSLAVKESSGPQGKWYAFDDPRDTDASHEAAVKAQEMRTVTVVDQLTTDDVASAEGFVEEGPKEEDIPF